jgi:ATP-citrate lyase beta-subunit
MAQKAIREYDAKKILQERWGEYFGDTIVYGGKTVQVTPESDWDRLKTENGWLKSGRLVVKPDQLIGKRGKQGLILLDADFETAKKWVMERMNKSVTIGQVTGILRQFIIEPFLPQKVEYYLAIKSDRASDTIYFSPSGGVDIEENWEKVVSIPVPVGTSIDDLDVAGKLPDNLSGAEQEFFSAFIKGIYNLYRDLHFTFLEFNPLAVNGNEVTPLDTKARLDDTASYLCGKKWCSVSFPPPFGREPFPEETYIKQLDEGTGASLKLTILNPRARVWTLNAGGAFTPAEIEEMVEIGYLNALFALARCIGIIGHIFDQKRLKTGLYRHPWDDIIYMVEKE